MFENSPIDSRLIDKINDTKTQIDQSSRVSQVNVGSWNDLNVADFAWVSNNVISVDASQINRFSVGDRIKITQTTIKYFVIGKIDTGLNRITVFAGSDYTFTNAAFTAISYSKLVQPTGFPATFTYASNLAPSAGGSITGISVLQEEFYVIGFNVFILINIQFTAGGGGVNVAEIDIPFQAFNYGSSGSTFAGAGLGVGSTATPQYLYAAFASGGGYNSLLLAMVTDIFNGASQNIQGLFQYRLESN